MSNNHVDMLAPQPKPRDVLETLKKLPETAYFNNEGSKQLYNTDAPVIALKRGVMGFYPIYTSLDADHLNRMEKVTPAQLEAMRNGSMFGWEIPLADPDSYNEDGTLRSG